MFDTNIASAIIKEEPKVLDYFNAKPIHEFCISSITEAELLFGLKKKPKAKKLHESAYGFLSIIDICPWDSMAASGYSELRSQANKKGKNLSSMDMLIASHCFGLGLTLITNNNAFQQFKTWVTIEKIEPAPQTV